MDIFCGITSQPFSRPGLNSCLTLLDSGQCVIHYGGHNPVALDGVLNPVQAEVDVLLVCPSHQDIPTMHVPVLKLQGLQQTFTWLNSEQVATPSVSIEPLPLTSITHHTTPVKRRDE